MAYRVTIPGSDDAEAGCSDSMGGSHISEVPVSPVSPVTESAAPPAPAKGSDDASIDTTGEVPSPEPIPDLDSRVLADHFGLVVPPHVKTSTINLLLAKAMRSGQIDPKHVTDLHEQVVAAVRALEWEIAAGKVKRQLRLVHGRPLADWLSLDDVARLLREGAR